MELSSSQIAIASSLMMAKFDKIEINSDHANLYKTDYSNIDLYGLSIFLGDTAPNVLWVDIYGPGGGARFMAFRKCAAGWSSDTGYAVNSSAISLGNFPRDMEVTVRAALTNAADAALVKAREFEEAFGLVERGGYGWASVYTAEIEAPISNTSCTRAARVTTIDIICASVQLIFTSPVADIITIH